MRSARRRKQIIQTHRFRPPTQREERMMSVQNKFAEERQAYIQFIADLIPRLDMMDLKNMLDYVLNAIEKKDEGKT